MKVCTICNSMNITEIYCVDNLPLFQNKVFDSEHEAKNQKTGTVTLVRCQECGFVFNSTFDSSLMDYDSSYQNEQNYSKSFIEHLEAVVELLENHGFKDKKIIEIGCGKGYFLDLLKNRGFHNITGFDPAYEGDSRNIVKDYFGAKYKSPDADLIILRHVLEHIEKPFHFLQVLKNATCENTKIFIEVPDFQWIKKNQAFWDIYHEHCNYFEFEFLKSFFSDSIIKSSFGNQYMCILASLNKLKLPRIKNQSFDKLFSDAFNSIKNFLSVKSSSVIWGASSKGVTFLNVLDKNKKYIKYAVDINPRKQDKFIATTGHKIFNPDILLDSTSNETVIVTNQNYFDEIKYTFKGNGNLQFYSLEKLING